MKPLTVTKRDTLRRRSMFALNDLDRLGINPIEELHNLFKEALKAYHSGRGVTETGDAGTQYLSIAVRIMETMAKFKHPTLAALALKDMTEDNNGVRKAITTEEALQIINSDPFAQRQITAESIIEAAKHGPNDPMLVPGEENVLKELRGKK